MSFWRALKLALLCFAFLAPVTAVPVRAQTEETTETEPKPEDTSSEQSDPAQPTQPSPESIEQARVLREEKRRIDSGRLAKAREIDVANAAVDDLIEALGTLQASVNAQSVRLADTQRLLAAAQVRSRETVERVLVHKEEISELQNRLKERAIRSFIGQGERTDVWSTGDPNVSVRQRGLAGHVLGNEIDLENALISAQEELQRDRLLAEELLEEAERLQREVAQELLTLEQDKAEQLVILAEAEDRLDQLLGERASLEALGERLDAELRAAERALSQELAGSPAPARPPGGTPVPPLASPSDIADAGNGILVHVSIVEDVRRLLADAAADGVNLGGGGFRDSSAQVRLRRKNCGTSNFAIYEMRASRCRPPTAKPGASMHERGLAIDFTYNGRLIRRRSGAGWAWLSQNASKYGFFNLPSEPWHFSTNGR